MGFLESGVQCKCSRAAHGSTKGFAKDGTPASYAPNLIIVPHHLDISITFDFPKRAIDGKVIVTVQDCRDPALPAHVAASTLTLNAVDFLDASVEAVAIPATAATVLGLKAEVVSAPVVPVSAQYDGQTFQLAWTKPFAPGEWRAVAVSYRVVRPVTGIVFGPVTASGADTTAPLEPAPARWAITDHETERARHWLPCVDFPAVRTALDFHLTAPADMIAVANGIEIGMSEAKPVSSTSSSSSSTSSSSTSSEQPFKTTHYRLEFPCPSYLVCFGVGPFAVYDAGKSEDGTVPIRYLGVRGPEGSAIEGATPDRLHRTFVETPKMLSWITKKLGVPYPFPKYYQIIGPGVGGAMENISLVSWDAFALQDEKYALEQQSMTNLTNIHEMAHSYFGDAVVCRHFDHAWLKESWAKFCELLWLKDNRSYDTYVWQSEVKAKEYIDECRKYQRPLVTNVFEHSWDMYDRHLYPGGAWRLHMLTHILGDAVFFKGVRNYLLANMRKTVETHNFRTQLEAAMGPGTNLRQFFDQWVTGRGFPQVTATVRYDPAQRHAQVELKQTQDFAATAAGTGEAFAITLEVAAELKPGVWATVPAQFTDLAKGTCTAQFSNLDQAPLQVVIDPEHKVLCRVTFDPGLSMLERTLRTYDCPKQVSCVTRSRAAAVLVKNYGEAGVAAVASPKTQEPFFGTRVDFASALADSGLPSAQTALLALLAAETHPEALHVLIRLAGNKKHPDVRAALLKLLSEDRVLVHPEFQYVPSPAHAEVSPYQVKGTTVTVRTSQIGGLPPRALGYLYQSLGKQQNLDDIPLLLTALATPVYHGVAQLTATRGLTSILEAPTFKTSPASEENRATVTRVVEAIIAAIDAPATDAADRGDSYAALVVRRFAGATLGLDLRKTLDKEVHRLTIERISQFLISVLSSSGQTGSSLLNAVLNVLCLDDAAVAGPVRTAFARLPAQDRVQAERTLAKITDKKDEKKGGEKKADEKKGDEKKGGEKKEAAAEAGAGAGACKASGALGRVWNCSFTRGLSLALASLAAGLIVGKKFLAGR